MKNNYNYLWIVLISFLVSCSDMNDLHQPYLDQGEHIYAAKVDAVVVRPEMNAFSWTCSIQHNVLKSVLFIGMFVRILW